MDSRAKRICHKRFRGPIRRFRSMGILRWFNQRYGLWAVGMFSAAFIGGPGLPGRAGVIGIRGRRA